MPGRSLERGHSAAEGEGMRGAVNGLRTALLQAALLQTAFLKALRMVPWSKEALPLL